MEHLIISRELFGDQINYIMDHVQTAICKDGLIDLNIICAEINIMLYQLKEYERNILLTDAAKIASKLVELHKLLEQVMKNAEEFE